jgi:twitching motility protein PilI
MAKRTSLREFQESLAAKLASARRGEAAQALLGVESGKARWLMDLADSGEVVPLTRLSPVPLTQPWFAGVANVRGALYSVVDFSAFRGGEPTPRNADARLLLIGARHGINSALLVDRTLGLKNLDGMSVEPPAEGGPAWIGESFTDASGQGWLRLRIAALLEDPAFLDVGLGS